MQMRTEASEIEDCAAVLDFRWAGRTPQQSGISDGGKEKGATRPGRWCVEGGPQRVDPQARRRNEP